jgi:hypothetical protein
MIFLMALFIKISCNRCFSRVCKITYAGWCTTQSAEHSISETIQIVFQIQFGYLSGGGESISNEGDSTLERKFAKRILVLCFTIIMAVV